MDSQAKGTGLNMEGGYSEAQILPNRWIVRFRGNSRVTPEKARDLCLLRVSALCQDRGYKFISIVEERSSNTKIFEERPPPRLTRTGFDESGNTEVLATEGESLTGTRKMVIHDILIECSNSGAPSLVEAKTLETSITKKYGINLTD